MNKKEFKFYKTHFGDEICEHNHIETPNQLLLFLEKYKFIIYGFNIDYFFELMQNIMNIISEFLMKKVEENFSIEI